MTEQLSKDTAKMHRLELENQRLKSEIEDLKLNGIKEQTEKCLKLERENKCQKLTIKQLQVKFAYSYFIRISIVIKFAYLSDLM